MKILESAQAASRERKLVLGGVDGALAIEQARPKRLSFALESFAFAGRDALAVCGFRDGALERLLARARVGALALEDSRSETIRSRRVRVVELFGKPRNAGGLRSGRPEPPVSA